MTTALRLPMFCAAVTLALFTSVGIGGFAHAAVGTVDEPSTTEPVDTEPPATEPPSTEPADTEPTSTEGGSDSAASDSVDATVTVVGVLAFIALIAVAAWWMVRRGDDDDQPHPPAPRFDDPVPGRDLI